MLVDDFRRDVLAIAKATESAVDFDDVIRIKASALGYVEKLEGYFSVFQKNHPNVDVKPLWQLVSHLRSIPLHSYDGWSKEHRFSLFQEKSQGWSRTLRAKAVAAWKVLKPLPESKLPKDENVVVSGFKCIFRGYESEGKSVSASYEFLERALDLYREKASRVFPVILRRQVPFLVDWTWGSNLGTNVAATYEGSHIILSPWVLSGKDPLKTVQMLAHEMGHHLFRTHLSDDDKSFWNSAIQSNREDVNLLDVVQTMTSKGYSYLEDMVEEFPELYIQMSTLEYSDYPDMWSLKKIQEYLNNGGNPIVRAPSIPITAYASKNTEEAFCEALGMSIAYGGRTVHPLVKHWLGVILGSQLRLSFNKKVKGMSKKFSPHEKSIALMKFLSNVARKEGVSESVYVVGGAVRNFLMKVPIKDIDVVIDSVALGGKDSAWFANALAKAIPTQTSLVTNTYGVAILTVKGSWILDGQDLQGEVIEIANARKESYDGVGGKGKGYKPSDVVPATIEEDVNRREFRFNTLLWKMRDLVNGPENAEVIDLTGFGRSDLDKKLMNTPVDPDKTFGDDPTRILRAVKFFLRYDMEIPPEVAAAMRRNAPKMKTMPWEAVATILVVDILDSPKAMKALPFMKSLGLLDVIVEMVSTIPAFATYLSRHLANSGSHSVELLLELADIGIAGRVLQFLTPPQRQRFKDITSVMEPEKAREFLGKLQAPPVNSEDLIQEFKLEGRDRGTLVPMARELILEDQSLAFDRPELNQAMRFRLNGSRSRSAASRKASRGTYVPTKDLPKLIVDELKQIGFNKKDIQVIPTTSFRPQGLSGDGTRAFITLISLIDGRTKTEMGSWGGANMFESKQVDVDDRERPLPRDFAVIKGTTGGYVFAELLVHPDNLAKFLPSGESVELTDKEKLALKAIATLTSSGRKDAFGYNRLGQYRPENPLIQSLITKGLVKSVGAGISITTDGKNVASGLPQIY